VQKFLIESPTKFDPAMLPSLPVIIDIDTAIPLRKEKQKNLFCLFPYDRVNCAYWGKKNLNKQFSQLKSMI
jgi:hypothetical protein